MMSIVDQIEERARESTESFLLRKRVEQLERALRLSAHYVGTSTEHAKRLQDILESPPVYPTKEGVMTLKPISSLSQSWMVRAEVEK